jgi:hypothetical protein
MGAGEKKFALLRFHNRATGPRRALGGQNHLPVLAFTGFFDLLKIQEKMLCGGGEMIKQRLVLGANQA